MIEFFFSRAYQKGLADGKRLEHKERNVPFADEYALLENEMSVLPEEVREDLKGLINSPSYDPFRKYLLHQVLLFYRDARNQPDKAQILNKFGDALRDIIADLDSVKIKPKEKTVEDVYEL